MKKLIALFLVVIICFCTTVTAYTQEKEETQNLSVPRLMVTDFKVKENSLTPNKKSKITITLKNYSKTKDIKNIKLSVNEESGEIKPVGTGSKYVDVIKANSSYTWQFELTASATAQIGEHAVTVTSEYEDEYFNSYTNSDTIRINVKQTVSLDFSGVRLPVKVYPNDTVTMDISFMNTGKSTIRNCKIDFDIKNFESGGTTYVGEIPNGEQCASSVNLRVGKELGDIEGTVIVTYEDDFGKVYKKEQNVSSKSVEKPIEKNENEDEKQAKYPLWWAFLLGGIVLGATVGCIVPISVYKAKQRKEDELRL